MRRSSLRRRRQYVQIGELRGLSALSGNGLSIEGFAQSVKDVLEHVGGKSGCLGSLNARDGYLGESSMISA